MGDFEGEALLVKKEHVQDDVQVKREAAQKFKEQLLQGSTCDPPVEQIVKQEPKVIVKQEPQMFVKQEPKASVKQEPKLIVKQEVKVIAQQEPNVMQEEPSATLMSTDSFGNTAVVWVPSLGKVEVRPLQAGADGFKFCTTSTGVRVPTLLACEERAADLVRRHGGRGGS